MAVRLWSTEKPTLTPGAMRAPSPATPPQVWRRSPTNSPCAPVRLETSRRAAEPACRLVPQPLQEVAAEIGHSRAGRDPGIDRGWYRNRCRRRNRRGRWRGRRRRRRRLRVSRRPSRHHKHENHSEGPCEPMPSLGLPCSRRPRSAAHQRYSQKRRTSPTTMPDRRRPGSICPQFRGSVNRLWPPAGDDCRTLLFPSHS
jgi:hypothetical protein